MTTAIKPIDIEFTSYTNDELFNAIESFLLQQPCSEPYWISPRYEAFKGDQDEFKRGERKVAFVHPGNSEGWILTVSSTSGECFLQAKYFVKKDALDSLIALTNSFFPGY